MSLKILKVKTNIKVGIQKWDLRDIQLKFVLKKSIIEIKQNNSSSNTNCLWIKLNRL